MPKGSVVAPPAISSPTCRNEPRFSVTQVERIQNLWVVLLRLKVRQVKTGDAGQTLKVRNTTRPETEDVPLVFLRY